MSAKKRPNHIRVWLHNFLHFLSQHFSLFLYSKSIFNNLLRIGIALFSFSSISYFLVFPNALTELNFHFVFSLRCFSIFQATPWYVIVRCVGTRDGTMMGGKMWTRTISRIPCVLILRTDESTKSTKSTFHTCFVLHPPRFELGILPVPAPICVLLVYT